MSDVRNKNINYISVLNVLAAISVVIIHTNGWSFWSYTTDKIWVINNIIESVFYFAVPIFFMTMGVTLIGYREKYSTKEFLKKRFGKTLIPFIFWSLFGIFYQVVITGRMTLDTISFVTLFNAIMSTSYVYIFWFFIALFAVYLFVPLLSSVEKGLRKNVFSYLLICCLFFNSVFPFINNIFNLRLNLPISFVLGNEYVVYLLLGYLLHNCKLNKKQEIFIYVLGIVGLLMHIIGTYNLSISSFMIDKTYKGYTNVPCILYSSAIFLFVKNICGVIKNKRFFITVNILKDYTFAIYLLHWFVMDLITIIFNPNTRNLLYTFGMPVIIIPICLFLTYAIRKIPIIKKILP